MSARHIEQHYGFGAARIALRSEMHRVSDAGFAGDFGAILAELGSGGPSVLARRFAGPVLGIVGTLAFLGFVIHWVVQEETSREALEVVMLESAEAVPPVIPPVVELPVEPEPIVPEPVVPEPVAPEPVVPEPPPLVAEARPEPPPPVPQPRIEPVRIEPEVAKVKPPPVVERAPRPVREQPVPVARPRVAIDAVAVAPDRVAPSAPVERLARTAVRPETRALPRMDAPAAPSLELPSEAAPERAFRVAAARAPAGGSRPRSIPGVAPAGLPVADVDLPRRRAGPRPGRSGRSARARGGPGRAVPRLEMAAAPAPGPAAARAVPQVVARAERVAAPGSGGAGGGGGGSRPGLSGVPLGELRACVTDREEDRLKQAVVAAVKAQSECVSSKGTYRFVETKNLNAFLMWIEQAPSRRVEDRCAELRYALECLQGASRRASR
ncbi:MAG: hypothetical protein R3F35_22865 [Myxococcota bacterium]